PRAVSFSLLRASMVQIFLFLPLAMHWRGGWGVRYAIPLLSFSVLSMVSFAAPYGRQSLALYSSLITAFHFFSLVLARQGAIQIEREAAFFAVQCHDFAVVIDDHRQRRHRLGIGAGKQIIRLVGAPV